MRTYSYWLTLVMILVMPWMDMVRLWELGTLSRIIGLIAAAFWGATVLFTGRVRQPTLLHWLAILFLLWTSATIAWSYDADRTWARMFIYLRMVGLILILWDLCERRSMIHLALQVYLVGAYIHAASVIYNYWVGVEDVYGRYAAAGNIANTTAYVLGMGLPLAWFLASQGEQAKEVGNARWLRVMLMFFNLAYIPVALMTIALSGTRFGILMAVPACLYGLLILLYRQRKAALPILIVLLLAVLALATFVPSSSYARLAEIDDSIRAGDLTGRITLWKIALSIWDDHPVVGIGSDAFPTLNRSGRAVHNSYLVVLVETGVIGLTLYLAILATVFVTAWRLPGRDSLFWLTVLVVWAVASLVLNLAHDKSIWLFFGLLLATARSAHSSQTEQQTGQLAEPIGAWPLSLPQPNLPYAPSGTYITQWKGN